MSSTFTHRACPVLVNALRIQKAIGCLSKEDPNDFQGWRFEFDNETERLVAKEDGMLARYTPQVGDYLVTQEDGYEYFNPKDVFERKYEPLEEPK